MLKMVSKKSMLLMGAVMALCAFVLPSVASAASWAGAGNIDSGNVGFSVAAINGGSSCAQTTFSTTFDSAQVLTITGATFTNCRGDIGGSVGCTTTAVGTNFPWVATPTSTSNIQIHKLDIDVNFETTPGTLNECANNGLNIRLTGTLSGLFFTPGAAGSRRVDFGPATGLVAHIPGVGSLGAAARGAGLATGTLNVLD
jgi:hypothetical protein